MRQGTAITKILAEVRRAEKKFQLFPIDPVHAAAIIVEESGELQQAALQLTYEHGTFDALEKEAVQVGAMAIRFLESIEAMKTRPSEQTLPMDEHKMR
jgi:hypothetical protein